MPYKMLFSALLLLLSGCAVYGEGYAVVITTAMATGTTTAIGAITTRRHATTTRSVGIPTTRRPRATFRRRRRVITTATITGIATATSTSSRDMTIAATSVVRSIAAGRFSAAGRQAATRSIVSPTGAAITNNAVAASAADKSPLNPPRARRAASVHPPGESL